MNERKTTKKKKKERNRKQKGRKEERRERERREGERKETEIDTWGRSGGIGKEIKIKGKKNSEDLRKETLFQ